MLALPRQREGEELVSDLIAGLVALIAAIPSAVAGAEEEDRERILRALDQARQGLTAIGPNAPTIRAAVERRLAEIEAANATVDTMLVEGQRGLAARREMERTERGDEPTREIPVDMSLGPRPR